MAGQYLRVFVACGTHTPFARLLKALVVVARTDGIDLFVQGKRNGLELLGLPGAETVSREQFAERLAWADVVVTHGGAGTLIEALHAGHHPIAVPRLRCFGEVVNDHQLEMIDALACRGLLTKWNDDADLLDLIVHAPRRGQPLIDARPRSLSQAVESALYSSATSATSPKVWLNTVRMLASRALTSLPARLRRQQRRAQ